MKLKLLFSLLFFVTYLNAQQDEPTKATSYKSITFNGIWSWFSDPRAVYFEGEHKRTYTGWVDNYGDIHIGYFDHEHKTINSTVVYDNLEVDDHNNPSILIDSKGYLTVFFNSHLQNGKPLYMLQSQTPESITNWKPLQELFLNDEAKNLNHTYTNPIRLSAENDKIFLFWRGIDLKPTYATSNDNGITWSKPKIFFLPNKVSSSRSPYTKVYSDGVSKIHFAITDGHPTKETSNALYYMFYEAGNFYKADKTQIKSIAQLPIIANEIDFVYKKDNEKEKVWCWDIAEDESGNPIIAYAKFPNKENHIYSYAIYKNGHWQNNELINSGNWFPNTPNDVLEAEPHYSGGMSIDKESPNIFYLSVKRSAFFEIEKWETSNWKNWTSKNITFNSKKDNIRPFAVRNALDKNNANLLWVQNTNYIYYSLNGKESNTTISFEDRFKTAIKINANYNKPLEELSQSNLLLMVTKLMDYQLENTSLSDYEKTIDYGMFLDALQSFSAIAKQERYTSELQNIQQHEENKEEEETDNESLESLIWKYNIKNNRQLLNTLNSISIVEINTTTINEASIIKLIELINDDSAINKDDLIKLFKKNFYKKISNKEALNHKASDLENFELFYKYALQLFAIAKGINSGFIPSNYKEKTIQAWEILKINIENNTYKELQWKAKYTNAFLLVTNEIYKLLEQ